MESVKWYHANINRHIAEALLIANGREGSFLLRKVPDGYCLSVRSKDSVKHFKVGITDEGVTFAHSTFDDGDQLLQVLANRVILCHDSGDLSKNLDQGTLITLMYPYPAEIQEPDIYDDMVMHSTVQCNATLDDLNKQAKPTPLASKSGFLTKRGDSFKTWKLRWIVLVRNDLSYYLDNASEKPIRTLNLEKCYKLSLCTTCPGKEYCFVLEFQDRNWHFSANSESDLKEWTQIIEWKLDQNRRSSLTTTIDEFHLNSK